MSLYFPFKSLLAASVIGFTDIQPIITAIEAQFSVTTMVQVLAAAMAIAIGFVFMWWAGRKVIKVIFAGARKGKVSV